MSKDAEYMKRAAQEIEKQFPDNTGFILFVCPYGADQTMRYTASIRREDAINVLKEWLIKAGGPEEWMKHIQ